MNKFVFVMDYLPEKVLGGAELSTQALIDLCPGEVIKIESSELDRPMIEQYKDAYWIFTNIWLMKWGLIPDIIRKLRYSIVEYDFKYCTYRSPDMHLLAEGIQCHCTNIFFDDFFFKAENVFFMSNRQAEWHRKKMPFLEGSNSWVISSLFSQDSLDMLMQLSKNPKEKDCWGIVFSRSGLKGFNEAVSYCEKKGINYRIFKDMNYVDLMESLSRCHGLVYKPIGGDTCPRVVIEAKLMGLELDLNYFVMHKDEHWFRNIESIKNHLFMNRHWFWKKVEDYDNK